MIYGKIVDGNLVEAPKIIRKDGRIFLNPSSRLLNEMGYKMVVFDDSINQYDSTYWKEEEDRIVQKSNK